MERLNSECSVTELLHCSEKLLNHFLDLAVEGDLEKIETAALSIAYFLSENSCNRSLDNDGQSLKNHCKVLSILFAAIRDYCKLRRITHDESYLRNPREVEKAWHSYCSCHERLDFVKMHIPSVEEGPIIPQLKNFRLRIDSLFGAGHCYVSPEVTMSQLLCSVCNEPIDSCLHTPGQIYDGQICKMLPDRITEVRSAAIVDNPRDLRNRIWPWRSSVDEHNQTRINVRLFTLWNIEDFEY